MERNRHPEVHADERAGPLQPPRQVWDLFVRVFHWSLVSCVVLNQWVLESGEAAHEWVGYTAFGLVVSRVVWGFVGSRYARFSDFFPTPRRVIAHLKALRLGKMPDHPGHNPLGALMMLALMALVLALGVTGWMQGTDAFWGEEWLQDLHAQMANGLLFAAGVHALSALWMGRLERVRLVRAMVTGIKEKY